MQNGKGWVRDLVPGSVAGPNIPIMVKFTPNKKETGSSPKGKGLFPFVLKSEAVRNPAQRQETCILNGRIRA